MGGKKKGFFWVFANFDGYFNLLSFGLQVRRQDVRSTRFFLAGSLGRLFYLGGWNWMDGAAGLVG